MTEIEALASGRYVDERCLALMALREHSSTVAEPITRRLLRDRSFRVRLDAAATVGWVRIASLADDVHNLAIADPHIRVRLWSIQALRYLRDPRWVGLISGIEGPGLNPYEQEDRAKLRRIARIAQGARPS